MENALKDLHRLKKTTSAWTIYQTCKVIIIFEEDMIKVILIGVYSLNIFGVADNLHLYVCIYMDTYIYYA